MSYLMDDALLLLRYFENTNDALVPPNPKELDMATWTCFSCDC